jgi:hypothetical protein
MRRATLLLCLLLLAAAGASPRVARADPFTDAFDALRTELEQRSGEFLPPLDRTEVRAKAAVAKALKLLGKRSTSLTTDLRTAVAILPPLERAYPSELSTTPVTSELRTAVGAAILRLRTLTEERRGSLAATIVALPQSPTRDKLQQAVGSAAESLAAASAEPQSSRAAKFLQAADRTIGKAFAQLAKLGNQLEAFAGGEPFEPTKVTAVYEQATGRLTITALFTRRGTPPLYQRLTLDGVVAQGPSQVTGTWAAGPSEAGATVYTAADARLNLMSFDLAAKRAAGTFDFLAFDAAQTPVDVGGGSFFLKVVVE